jgi:hypothetical protein
MGTKVAATVPIRVLSHREAMHTYKRITVAAADLDRYLNEQLQRVRGFENIRLSAGYRLSSPDADGCNWSGKMTCLHGPRAPAREVIDATLRPIVAAARARFNLLD